MYRRIALTLIITIISAGKATAKEIILSIGGSVGVFRTDMRVWNPSYSKDIQVQASLLPVGSIDNSAVVPKVIVVPRRQMLVYDDVVASLFAGAGLAAIRLKSDDDFTATQRIYAQSPAGTLGQFVPGVDTSIAKKQGVLLQLKANSSYRTNIGAVNPSLTTANVTWRIYDKNNAAVGSGRSDLMPALAVIGPQNVATYLNAGAADLSDAWVTFTSDQPVIAYASVVDNGTTDPAFITMDEDTGKNFQADWNAFVDALNACFQATSCKSQTTVNMCSCVTSQYENQTVSWQGVHNGVSTTTSNAVGIKVPDRTVISPKGITVAVATPILLQNLSSAELASWNAIAPGTTVRFRTTIGIIRFVGTGFVGSGGPFLIFTATGGQVLP